jgi:hypothetical protein
MAPSIKPTFLKEFMSKYDDLTKFADSREFFIGRAYSDAALASLMDEKGQVDYKKLDDPTIRLAVLTAMQKDLTDKAIKNAKCGEGLNWLQKEQQMLVYAGMTGGQLKNALDSEQSDFNASRVATMATGLKRNAMDTFQASTYSQIPDTEEARKSIIDELKISDKIDAGKARLEDLVNLMTDSYRNSGVVSQTAIKRSPAYKP